MNRSTTETPADDAPAATAKSGAGDKAGSDTASSAATVQAVTIDKPASELFAMWRDLSKLPTFMDNVERIDVLDDRRSHWVVSGPTGTVEWDARLTEIEEDRLLAWESEPGADVANSGRVTFTEAGARGTVVTATIVYDPPAGVVGKLVAKLFQREPALQARRDLRRFKQLMETGEISTNVRNRAQIEREGK